MHNYTKINILFSDNIPDALVEELRRQLSPQLIIATDEIKILDVCLGQGITLRHIFM